MLSAETAAVIISRNRRAMARVCEGAEKPQSVLVFAID